MAPIAATRHSRRHRHRRRRHRTRPPGPRRTRRSRLDAPPTTRLSVASGPLRRGPRSRQKNALNSHPSARAASTSARSTQHDGPPRVSGTLKRLRTRSIASSTFCRRHRRPSTKTRFRQTRCGRSRRGSLARGRPRDRRNSPPRSTPGASTSFRRRGGHRRSDSRYVAMAPLRQMITDLVTAEVGPARDTTRAARCRGSAIHGPPARLVVRIFWRPSAAGRPMNSVPDSS